MLKVTILRFLKLYKYHNIYTCSYLAYEKALNGDLIRLKKSGIYNKNIAFEALNSIIEEKINIFGLDKQFIRDLNLRAEIAILEIQAINNPNSSAKSRLNILIAKAESKKTKLPSKNTEIDIIGAISDYYKKPINPNTITVYEVFSTIKQIKDGNHRRQTDS
jgi:hypothetical protein